MLTLLFFNKLVVRSTALNCAQLVAPNSNLTLMAGDTVYIVVVNSHYWNA